jgi:GntR family transcriptional regulator
LVWQNLPFPLPGKGIAVSSQKKRPVTLTAADRDELVRVTTTGVHPVSMIRRPITPLIRLGNDRYSPKYRESGLSPFLLECAKQGKTGRFEVLSIDRVQPPAEVAERLNVSPHTKSVLRRENVFYADDDPVHRVTTYVPWPIAKGTGLLQEEVPHPYGIHGVLEDQHHTMTRIREEISTRMPRPEEISHLQLRPGVPVLDVLHTSIDQDGEPYEVTRFVMRGDMTGLLYDTPVE